MTLESLLTAIRSTKSINVNLYDNADLLLISFVLPGFESLDPNLLSQEVKSIELPAVNALKITLKAI